MTTFNGFLFTEGTMEEKETLIQALTQHLEERPLTMAQVAEVFVQTMDLASEMACQVDEDDEETLPQIRQHLTQLQSIIENTIPLNH